MRVIQAHRERSAELAEDFRKLLEMELNLFNLRSKSWELQLAGTESRETDLESVHELIENIMIEVENLRQALSSPVTPTSSQSI